MGLEERPQQLQVLRQQAQPEQQLLVPEQRGSRLVQRRYLLVRQLARELARSEQPQF